MNYKLLLVVSLCAGLSACATTVYYPEESRNDWNACVQQVDNNPSYGIGPLAQMARNMAYDNCMSSRGWSKTQ